MRAPSALFNRHAETAFFTFRISSVSLSTSFLAASTEAVLLTPGDEATAGLRSERGGISKGREGFSTAITDFRRKSAVERDS